MTVQAGTTTTLTVQWRAYEGGPAQDVTAQTITITRLSDTVIVAGPTAVGITHVATGLYAYPWSVPVDAAAGDYAAVWNAIDQDSEPVQASEVVTVAQVEATGDAYATVYDYEKRAGLQPTTGVKRAQIAAALDDVSDLIRGKLPDGFTPAPATARRIAVAVARRAMANPGGYRQRMFGSYSETLDQDGGLYLTEAELAEVLGQDELGEEDGAYTLTLPDAGFCFPHAHHRGW